MTQALQPPGSEQADDQASDQANELAKEHSKEPGKEKSTAMNVAALGLVVLVLGLGYFKWGASWLAVSGAHTTHTFDIKTAPYVSTGMIGGTIAYFKKVWIALTFGVLLGGTLRVAITPSKVAEWLGGKGARSMLQGALAGAPLFLCSCCVTPIFSGLHKRGARLGPNLAVMFAAPALNVAALAVTLFVFPTKLGILRIASALVIVFGLAPLVGRAFEAQRRAAGLSETCAIAEEPEVLTLKTLPLRWVKSVGYIALMTLPIVVFGVLLSTLLLPYMQSLSQQSMVLAVVVTALIGAMVALPTFLEIPLALSLLAAGAPAGAAMALLIAGPVINLPSLLVLAREVSPRAAISVFVGVWCIASFCGLIVGGI
jgi:uncharacterized protein